MKNIKIKLKLNLLYDSSPISPKILHPALREIFPLEISWSRDSPYPWNLKFHREKENDAL